MANRYGVDMGKIMEQTSVLKTAKLRRDKLSKDMEREDYEDEAYGASIEKDNPNAIVMAIDADESGDISSEEQTTARRKTGMKYNALSNIEDRTEKRIDNKLRRGRASRAEARRATKEKEAKEKEIRQQGAREKMYISHGDSPAMAKTKAELKTSEVKNFASIYSTSSTSGQKAIKQEINNMGQQISNLIELSGTNPQMANEKYVQFRTDKLKQENEYRKSGHTEAADKVAQGLNGMPETLLGKDGKFNTTYLMDSLMLLKQQEDTTNDLTPYQKQTKKQSDRTHTHKQENSLIKSIEKSYGKDTEYDEELRGEMNKVKEMAIEIQREHPKYSIPRIEREAKERIKNATTKSGNLKASTKFYGKKITYKGKRYNVDNKGNMALIK